MVLTLNRNSGNSVLHRQWFSPSIWIQEKVSYTDKTSTFLKFWPHLSYFRILHRRCPFANWRTKWCYFIFYILWGRPHFVGPKAIYKDGLPQPKLILDSKAFGLATQAWPWTAGPLVLHFMSAWSGLIQVWETLNMFPFENYRYTLNPVNETLVWHRYCSIVHLLFNLQPVF